MLMPPSAEYIYNDLIQRIIDLSLEPGSKISENKIGEEYNVSRSVIRHVFARLSQINFIEVYPQRGTFITKIDLEYIHTVLIMRLAIEKEMIARFMKLEHKGTMIEQLRENVKKQRQYGNQTKYLDDFRKLDEDFHGTLMLGVGKYNILLLMDEHLLHLSRWRNLSVSAGNKISELICEHELILQGIEEGNFKKVNEVIEVHIETAFSTVDRWCDTYQHYFENFFK